MKRTQVWAGLAIVLAVSLAGCGGAAAPQWTYAPDPSGGVAIGPAASPAASQAPAASQPPSGDVLGTLEVTGVDLGFKPATLSVDNVGAYEVKLVTGSILHDITFPDGTKIEAKAGEAAAAVVQVP